MIFTQSFTVRPPGASADECVSALLDVESASDFTLKLMRKCGCVVDYVSLESCDRAEIARWVNERVDEWAAFERDQAQEMAAERYSQLGTRWPYGRRA